MHHLFSILDRHTWYTAIRVCKKWYNIGISNYVIQKVFDCQNYKDLIEQTKKNYYIYNDHHDEIFKTYLGILHLKTYSNVYVKYVNGDIIISHVDISRFMIVKKSHAITLLNFYKKNRYLEQIKTDRVRTYCILKNIKIFSVLAISGIVDYYVGLLINHVIKK